MTEVAIIGAGPAGLAAARYLRSEGFEPVVFEQGSTIGGQWSGDRAHSGIWPSMCTNTSRILTAFSDLPHANGSQVYPSNQMIRDYLVTYAEQFSLTSRVRLRTPVVALERRAGSKPWLVRTAAGEQSFAYVIVATGAFQRWTLPDVPGLASFSGDGGVAHTFQYADSDGLRGRRVLVAGGAISALEIASDLAMAGARVTVTVRRSDSCCRSLPREHQPITSCLRAFTRWPKKRFRLRVSIGCIPTSRFVLPGGLSTTAPPPRGTPSPRRESRCVSTFCRSSPKDVSTCVRG